MLQLPNGERERGSGLSVIHEDVSAGRASPSVNSASGSATTAAPPPTWFTNHSIDYGKNDVDIDTGGNGSTVETTYDNARFYRLGILRRCQGTVVSENNR